MDVSVGEYHSCGINAEAAVVCWGENHYGQASPPPGRFTQVSVGHRHSCAVSEDRSAVCWGGDLTFGADFGDGRDSGRIAVRLTSSGFVQVAFEPDDRELVAPRAGLVPTTAQVGSSYLTSPIVGEWSKHWGAIRARSVGDGFIELALVSTEGVQLEPLFRFLPGSLSDQWVYSDVIELRD